MCQEDFGDELMTIPHEVVRTSGLPGVYDISEMCSLVTGLRSTSGFGELP